MNRCTLLVLLCVCCVHFPKRIHTLEEFNDDYLARSKRDVDEHRYEFGRDGSRKKLNLKEIKHIVQITREVDNRSSSSNSIEPYHPTNTIKMDPEVGKNEKLPVVSTSGGTLRGIIVNQNGVKYYAFHKIPYAEPPKRFQNPKPPKPWKGIRNATHDDNLCFQKEFFGTVGGKEDCLYLSIHTPTLQENKKLPVIVWINGGKFKTGTANSNIYNPENLMKEDIIVVNIYYRIGVFGFLSTNTKHAPGNSGLKDIVMSLRWLRKNIHMFGGDTYNLCLYGVSSGGAAVEYINLSPLAKGLFDKVIAQSGSALNNAMFIDNPLDRAFQLGRYLGFRTKKIDDLMDFLMQVNATRLAEAANEIDDDDLSPFRINFGPSVEKYVSDESFLIDSPEKILKMGTYSHVPYIVGFTDKEGTSVLQFNNNVTAIMMYFNELFDYTTLDLTENLNTETRSMISDKIKKYYFKDRAIDINVITEFIDFAGDIVFLYGIQKSAHLRAQHVKAPLYYFKFAYYDDKIEVYNPADKYVTGAGHSQDLAYVFKFPHKPLKNPKSLQISKILINLIKNFLKYGNPTPEKTPLTPILWPRITTENVLPCMVLNDTMYIENDPFNNRYLFWNELYKIKRTSR